MVPALLFVNLILHVFCIPNANIEAFRREDVIKRWYKSGPSLYVTFIFHQGKFWEPQECPILILEGVAFL